MKKIIAIFLALLCVALTIQLVVAANPTVTTTRSESLYYVMYSFSFATSANLDTAIIGDESGRAINVDGVCAHHSDSLIIVELKSSETTADSNRHIVAAQFTSASSPSMTSTTTTDWITQYTDASSFDSVATGAVVKFAKIRLAGNATKMRLLVWDENDTTDAIQTVTGRILIPKREYSSDYVRAFQRGFK